MSTIIHDPSVTMDERTEVEVEVYVYQLKDHSNETLWVRRQCIMEDGRFEAVVENT